MVPRFPAVLLLLVCSLAALGADSHGSRSAEGEARAESLAPNGPRPASATSTVTRLDDGIFVMQASDAVTPNANRMDLIGHTVRAEPLPGDRFRVTRGSLAAQAVTGDPTAKLMARSQTGWHYSQQELPFAFPLGSRTYRTAYVSAFGGIYFEAPPTPPQDQYNQAAAIAPPVPLVAPLLIGRTPRWGETHIRVRSSGNSFAVTWTFVGVAPGGEVPFGGEVQAVLHESGTIELSYLRFSRFLGGAAVITTGSEPVREQRATLARVTDATGDGATADIRSLEISHIDALDQLEFRIELVSDVAIPLNARVVLKAKAKHFDQEFRAPAAPSVGYPSWRTALPVIVRSGSTMRILMHEAHLLPPDTLQAEVTLYDDARAKLDSVAIASFDLPVAPRMPVPDLSAASASTYAMPIAEAFTIPGVNVHAVWGTLAAQYHLDPDTVEAVMVFTSFPEYLEYWASSSTNPGNAGVDGLGTGYSSDQSSRFPALIDLGSAELPGDMLHELGHRWLFYPMLKDGQNRVAFNDFGHIPYNVDSTAALVPGGRSPMGGMPFLDRGNGKYDIVCGEKGFTWLELYLMGLAAPSEVKPMLQITQGRVDRFCGGTAEAQQTRHVTIEQVIEGTRLRNPPSSRSPKVFPIAYVLIDDPVMSMIPDALERVRSHAALLTQEFAKATGGRGRLTHATGRKTRRHPSN
jgi:hypothetical protein